MHRFIINLPDDVFEKLREIAYKKKISISKLAVGYIIEQIETEKGE